MLRLRRISTAFWFGWLLAELQPEALDFLFEMIALFILTLFVDIWAAKRQWRKKAKPRG